MKRISIEIRFFEYLSRNRSLILYWIGLWFALDFHYFYLKIVRKCVKMETYTSSCLGIKLEFEEAHYE